MRRFSGDSRKLTVGKEFWGWDNPRVCKLATWGEA